MSAILGRIHRRLGQSSLVTTLAIKARNQLNQVIHHSLSDGPDCRKNGEAWLVRDLAKPGTTFVDVGANVGEWSALYRESAPESVGIVIDASQAACKRLVHRFSGHKDITVIRAALSDSEGVMPFYEEANAGTHSSLVQSFASDMAIPHSVRVTTLDAEMGRLGIQQIHILKIDCEGYDLHVLRGARRLLSERRVGTIQFEYNLPWREAGSTLKSALSLLDSFGYATFLLKKDGLHPFDYDRYGEFFACTTFVAR